MADIEIAQLSDRLEDDEIAELTRALQKAGAPKLPGLEDAASVTVAANLDDDVLAEFLDHLEASDLACDVYLPIAFDGRVEAAELRIGSLSALVDALDEIREDLDIEDEDDKSAGDDEEEEEEEDEEEEEESYDLDLIDKQLRQVWRYFHDGAHAAMERQMSLFVVGG